jgi:hypothetical protein
VPATRKRCTKHAPFPKSECGYLNGGKSKAVTNAFPGYRENAEEEENEKVIFIQRNNPQEKCSRQEEYNTYPVNLVAFFQSFSILVHSLVGSGAFCLEPHALHLIQALHSRHSFLRKRIKNRKVRE